VNFRAPEAAQGPFALPRPPGGTTGGLLFDLARPVIEKALAFPTLNRLYSEAAALDRGETSRARSSPGCPFDARSFYDRALAVLGVGWDVPEEDLHRVPANGPFVVVANHPFGGIDGLILLSLLRRIRPDVRLIGNFMLERLPELRDFLFPVDPFGGPAAPARSATGLRAALRWVADGGALGIFPAGEVAHLRVGAGGVIEPEWTRVAGRLVRRASVPVLPVFFAGRNSSLFQVVGLIHPRLRTVLLPSELLRHRGTVVQVRIGGPIAPARLASFDDPADLAAYLRARTGLLRARCSPQGGAVRGPSEQAGRVRRARVNGGSVAASGHEEIAPAVSPDTLERSIAAVPAAQLLLLSGPHVVLYTRGEEQPGILREIGRLREVAFRAAGEGTGRGVDLDRFDAHYLHLFVWNRDCREILGAYRVGPTDEILPRLGRRGLYTSTLFRFRRRLLDQIDPALELGRSFVRPERQKDHAPLTLLWKGIGLYAAAHPRYRMLFGPVTISNEYRSLSRDLLMAFLRATRYEDGLARLVRPRHPVTNAPGRGRDPWPLGTVVRSLDDVEDLVREIEADRKGVPVLLRQYLRLNAVLLGFNVDPDFSDVLDGLVLVDLARVDRAILARFMGREKAERFLALHAAEGGSVRDRQSGHLTTEGDDRPQQAGVWRRRGPPAAVGGADPEQQAPLPEKGAVGPED